MLDTELQNGLEKERTEEVTAIIERMPVNFGFWVTAISLSLGILLFVFGWFIKYPDVLKGQLTITARQSNVKLVSSEAGRLDLIHAQSGDMLNAGDYIAVIKNAARTNDVKLVDSLLKKVNIHQVTYENNRKYFPENVSLGELNTKYYGFLNALYQYLDYSLEKPFTKQKNIGQKLLKTQKELISEANENYMRLKKKAELAKSLNQRDSILYNKKVITAVDVEKSLMARISTEQEFAAITKEITNNTYSIDDASNKLQELEIQKTEKERELEINLFNSYYDLQENIKEWERKYVFISPINGKLEFRNFLKPDDYIQSGQELFTVIPTENAMVGQVFLPEQGAGKVKEGEDVIIKLDNYPYSEYGSVKGKVKNISMVTNPQLMSNTQNKVNAYLVTVALPNGLNTNYGSALSFRFEAKGTAEIITNDKRLLQRLFDNLKYRIK